MPVVSGDKVFIQAEPATLICLSKKEGKILWSKSTSLDDALSPEQKNDRVAIQPKVDGMKREIEQLKSKIDQLAAQRKANPADASLKTQQDTLTKSRDQLNDQFYLISTYDAPTFHPTNGHSSATPICDGKNIFVLFGTGVAACFDLDGNRKWARFMEKPLTPWGWGLSSSPRLVDGKLIIFVDTLWALDPATGKDIWRISTPVGWGTLVVTKIGKDSALVTPQGGGGSRLGWQNSRQRSLQDALWQFHRFRRRHLFHGHTWRNRNSAS